MGILPWYPPWVPFPVYIPGIYASLPCTCLVRAHGTHLRTALLQRRITVLFGMLKRQGFSPRKRGFLPPENNLLRPGNPPNKANKPATESTRAQGEQESPNPSKGDVKPP